jgi:hypothetical protein
MADAPKGSPWDEQRGLAQAATVSIAAICAIATFIVFYAFRHALLVV